MVEFSLYFTLGWCRAAEAEMKAAAAAAAEEQPAKTNQTHFQITSINSNILFIKRKPRNRNQFRVQSNPASCCVDYFKINYDSFGQN